MTKRLTQTVHAADDGHSSTAFAGGTPESELPAWAKAKIGAHAFYDDSQVEETENVVDQDAVPFGAPTPAGESFYSPSADAAPAPSPTPAPGPKSKSAKSADSK